LDSYLCGNQERICTGRPILKLDFASVVEDLNETLLPDTLFCNDDQRISEDITLRTFDSTTNAKLGNVDVFYYCGSYQNDCFIGNTDSDGNLKTKFPQCINGIIYMLKEGYSELREPLTVYNEPARLLSYNLAPIKEIDIDVKKIDLQSYVRNFFETESLDIADAIVSLNDKEFASITLSGPHLVKYNYPDPTGRKIELSSGSYDLTIFLNGKIDIADTKINGKTLTGPKGNYPFGLTIIKWDILKNEVKDKVTFYALSNYDTLKLNPGTYEDIDDPILGIDGKLAAELLYKCEKSVDETGKVSCNDECDFVAADGIVKDDFVDNNETCERAYDIVIKKEEYEPFIKPQFS